MDENQRAAWRPDRRAWLLMWSVAFGMAAALAGPSLIQRCLPRRYTPPFFGSAFCDRHPVQVEWHGQTAFTCWAWAREKHRPGTGDGEVLIGVHQRGSKVLAITIPSLAVKSAGSNDSPAQRRLTENTLLDAMHELGIDDTAPDVRELAAMTFDVLDRYARGTLTPTRMRPRAVSIGTKLHGKDVYGQYFFNPDASTPVPGMVLLVMVVFAGIWAGGVAVILRCTRHLVYGPPPTPRPPMNER